jgi:hypothetical protein
LHLRQAVTDTAVNAEAEEDLGAVVGTLDNELIGVLDGAGIPLTGQLPPHRPGAFADLFALELQEVIY